MWLMATMKRETTPICVDARMAYVSGGTGTTTYSQALVTAAKSVGHPFLLLSADHESDGRARKLVGSLATEHALRESKVGTIPDARSQLVGRDIFRRAHVHFSVRRQFMRLIPPRRFGIMHWTYPVPIQMKGWINIYTVHDLIPLTHPHLSPICSRRHRAVMRELLQCADRIVTVSEASRSSIVSELDVDGSFVVNCGQAVFSSPYDAQIKPPLNLAKGNYFVFCGAVEPRKNLVSLLKAHALSGVDMPLVIAGPDGWRAKELNSFISQTPNVIRSGYLAREELLGLIHHARGLLFPSLAEGRRIRTSRDRSNAPRDAGTY
jgi:glycosyltransferase involved in cell wall biosynthesis